MNVQRQKRRRQKRRRIPWGRWLIALVVFVLIICGSILWIEENQGPWINILPVVIFTVLGVVIGLFQWLFPVSSEAPDFQAVPAHTTPMHLDTTSNSSSLPPQIIVHVPSVPPPAEQSLPVGKTTYRSIVGVPPPTDPRTIQQREKAVKEIYAQLTRDDITAVALTGIGGVGKSTLAALVYRHAEEQRRAGKGRFTQEALWLKIDSAAVTMTDLAGTIFDTLGKPLPNLSTLAPHNQAATLFNALNTVDNARLIVLDQFENLLDWQTGYALADRPGVGEWLDAINSQACACRILLTSRPWPQGTRGYPPTYMQEYHVRGLDLAEGVELLRKLGIDAPEVELQLAVSRCAGHAFALTLLASLLRNRNLSLSTFFKDPSYAQLWTGNVARNLLDHIYSQQLDEVQRKLLLAFSVYREPVSLEAAHAIADVSHDLSKAQANQALDGLLAQRLLQPSGEGLYQLHTVVISYARHHFDVSSEQANQQALRAAYARAAQYYRQYAALHCPRREQRKQRSDVQPLVEAVWQHCQAEQWQEAYELLEQESLHTDLLRWGSSAVLLELYQLLLPLDRWQPAQAARIYDELGEIYRSLGQMEQSRDCFEQALALCKATGNRKEEGWALNNIGRVYADTGNKQQALDYYEEALEVHKEVGNLGGESTVLTNIGWAHYDFRRLEVAREKYEQALSIRREVKDRKGEASVLNSLGRVYANLGQIETARQYHEQALGICREAGDRVGEGWTLNNLGRVYVMMGDTKRALDYLQQALSIRREVGDRRGEGATLNNLGITYSDLGQGEEAVGYFKQALTIRREVGDRRGEGKTLNGLGLCYMRMHQPVLAAAYFRQSLSVRRALGENRRQIRTLNNLGACYIDLNRYDTALACFLVARALCENVLVLEEDPKKYVELTRGNIDGLSEKIGAEKFAELLAHVEPGAQQVVEGALREQV